MIRVLSPSAMTDSDLLSELRFILVLGPSFELPELETVALRFIVEQLAEPHGGGRSNIASAERLAQVLSEIWRRQRA